VPGQRQIDIGQNRLDLVEVEVRELVGRREHDVVAPQPVGCVEQVVGVQLEQPAKQQRLNVIALRGGPDVDREHHGVAGPHHDDGQPVARRGQHERPLLGRLEGAVTGHEVGFQVFDGAGHACGQRNNPRSESLPAKN
jgi:hypothetical protein